MRIDWYLNESVRPTSDSVAAASGLQSIDDILKKKLSGKQCAISRFRQAMGHLAKTNPIESTAKAPLTRAEREKGQP